MMAWHHMWLNVEDKMDDLYDPTTKVIKYDINL